MAGPGSHLKRDASSAGAGSSRSEMVAAATHILDTEGASALTVRRLGAELQASAATVYWRFRDRVDLLCAILDEQLATVDSQDDQTSQPIVAAVELYLRLAAAIAPSIRLVPDIGYEVFSAQPSMLDLTQRLWTFLRQGGHTDGAAAELHHVTMALLLGVLEQLADEAAAATSKPRDHLRRLEAQSQVDVTLGDRAGFFAARRPDLNSLRPLLNALLTPQPLILNG